MFGETKQFYAKKKQKILICLHLNNIVPKPNSASANRMPKCISGWMSLWASRLMGCVIARKGIIWWESKRFANSGAMKLLKLPTNTLLPT